MVRKWPTVDILQLYSGTHKGFDDDLKYLPISFDDDSTANIDASRSHNILKSHHKWNLWLSRCLKNQSLDELMKTRYGLQVGMDDLVKKGLATASICEMFVRWTKSIEKTARQIIKRKHKITRAIATDYFKALEEKRRIDAEFEKFLRESSF